MSRATTTEMPRADRAGADERSAASAWSELLKPRLSGLVLVTTAVGYVLGSADGFAAGRFLAAMVGTGLLACAASALNQWWEIPWDRRMERTRTRPLPTRRLSPAVGLVFGLLAGLSGLAVLGVGAGRLTAVLGAVCLLVYVVVYTPLKRRTTLCTVVGAVTGALPPVMGWTAAAAGSVGAGAWVLFGILFVWQIPHFLAIAWLYREDYARGGFKMLPVVDPRGTTTGGVVVLYCLALVPVSLTATLVGLTGWLYPVGAFLLGVGFLGLGMHLQRERTEAAARRLFVASITYLPLLLALMVLDPTGHRG